MSVGASSPSSLRTAVVRISPPAMRCGSNGRRAIAWWCSREGSTRADREPPRPPAGGEGRGEGGSLGPAASGSFLDTPSPSPSPPAGGRGDSWRLPVNRGLAPLGADTVHVVIDMQRLFDEETGWRVADLGSVVPAIVGLIEHRPARALYARFITPARIEETKGAWQSYYRQWPQVIADRLPPGIFDLVAPLAPHAAAHQQFDKRGFSAFSGPSFAGMLG